MARKRDAGPKTPRPVKRATNVLPKGYEEFLRQPQAMNCGLLVTLRPEFFARLSILAGVFQQDRGVR
jgi:hypothetical protein